MSNRPAKYKNLKRLCTNCTVNTYYGVGKYCIECKDDKMVARANRTKTLTKLSHR